MTRLDLGSTFVPPRDRNMGERDGSEVEFSLTRGGPLYRLLTRVGVLRPGKRDSLRPAAVFVALTWLPMSLAALVQSLVTRKVDPILLDPAVHARLLVAAPLFFLAEAILDERSAHAYGLLLDHYVGDARSVEAIARRAERFRDSRIAEALMLALAIDLGVTVLSRGPGFSGVLQGMKMEGSLSVPLGWYALVAYPMFEFLLLRLAYRWLIWSRMLIGLSRIELRLVPTHPDLAGGIGFLAHPVQPFSVAVLGLSAIAAASWGYLVAVEGRNPTSFAPSFLVFVAAAWVLAFAPLLSFSRLLWHRRRDGLRQYNVLALRYVRLFHERWIDGAEDDASLLGSPDIQSLSDMGSSYERLDQMRLVVFGPRPIITVLAAALAPMLPLFAINQPIPELIAKIGRAILGGLP